VKEFADEIDIVSRKFNHAIPLLLIQKVIVFQIPFMLAFLVTLAFLPWISLIPLKVVDA
jgi:hypothetical protein